MAFWLRCSGKSAAKGCCLSHVEGGHKDRFLIVCYIVRGLVFVSWSYHKKRYKLNGLKQQKFLFFHVSVKIKFKIKVLARWVLTWDTEGESVPISFYRLLAIPGVPGFVELSPWWSLPLPLLGLDSWVCVSHIGLGFTLIQYNCKDYLQIRSHSQVPAVRILT
jgi:hypothetical protein